VASTWESLQNVTIGKHVRLPQVHALAEIDQVLTVNSDQIFTLIKGSETKLKCSPVKELHSKVLQNERRENCLLCAISKYDQAFL